MRLICWNLFNVLFLPFIEIKSIISISVLYSKVHVKRFPKDVYDTPIKQTEEIRNYSTGQCVARHGVYFLHGVLHEEI